jgi:fatty acid desaturase
MGLRRQTQRFVPAGPVRRDLPAMPINANITHTIDAAPVATQHVEMKTSAVDRALGFLIASVPLYAGFALLVLLVTVFYAGVPFLSLPALVIFWLSFVAAWVVGYTYTLSVSAEGVSHYESRQKWAVIKEEQRRRWEHYEKLTDQSEGK